MSNPYTDTILRRHEARKRFLPALGFTVPHRPNADLLAQAAAAWDIARWERQRNDHQRRRTWKALQEGKLSDRDLWRYIQAHPITGGAPTLSYIVYNAAMATTAAPVKQPTGTAIRTMMQLKCATGYFGRVFEWGCSFDGSAAATPGAIELIETGTVGATALSAAYAAADIQPYEDPNSPANTAGTGGVPFNLGTSASGFATAAVTEGSTTASRMLDYQLVAPTNQYVKQFPLGREPGYGYYAAGAAAAINYLRCRMTFGTTVNAAIYVCTEF